MVAAFRDGLKDGGYIVGQNVAIEYRWANAQYDRVLAMATELVDRRVAVIVANTPGVQAVKAVITMTPSCARVASAICSGHPSARAAAAIFSMTRSHGARAR